MADDVVPEDTNPLVCDCARLIAPLDYGEKLPDHWPCLSTREETVWKWFQFRLQAVHLVLVENAEPPLSFNAHEEIMRIGRFVERIPEVAFPLRVNGRYLVLVLQQWVEDKPDSGLARRLQKDSEYQREREHVRALLGGEHPTEPITGRVGRFRVPDLLQNVLGDEATAARLSAKGIPASLSIARYLIAEARGEKSEQLPGVGALITTQAFTRGQVERAKPHDGHPATSVEAVFDNLSPLLRDRIRVVQNGHRKWLADFNDSRLMSENAKRRSRSGSFALITDRGDSVNTDYERAALDPDAVATMKIDIGRGTGRAVALDKHLRRVEGAVGRARARHTPPISRISAPLWKPEMEEKLKKLLPP